MKRYNLDTVGPVRADLHNMTAGAWLPLAQATITGAAVGVLVLVVAMATRSRHPFTWSAVVALVVLVLTWLQLQSHWFKLTDLERLTGLDLNGDGPTGGPRREPAEVRVRVSQVKPDGHYQENIYPLPADLEQLQTLAAGLLAGEPFAERHWTGAGRPFSVEQFRTLRGEMVRRGLLAMASPKDPRQGYSLTLAGRHVLAGIAADIPSPTEPVLIG